MPSSPRTIVTLTTDFGTESPYVAQMKGVILSRNSEVQLVDISHRVAPQDILGGALIMADTCHRFPPHTIHVGVVDPGVGTDRKIVFAEMGHQRFIAPDNGLLTLLAQRTPPSQLFAVTNRTYFLSTVSPTFHGRDIFAPVAAHLSLGLSPKRLGEKLAGFTMLAFPHPVIESQRITGQVIQIDSFGNLITNVLTSDLPTGVEPQAISVHCRSAVAEGLSPTYGCHSPGNLVALFGSSGRLELAVVNGNAAAKLAAGLNEPVSITW